MNHSAQSSVKPYLCTHNSLHDGLQRFVQLAFVHALKPFVAMLIGLLEGHIKVVVCLLRSKVLKYTISIATDGSL